MSAPALSIPVRANLDAFKQQMSETSSLARGAARKVAQEFVEINKNLAGGAVAAGLTSAAGTALRFAAVAGTIAVAWKAAGAVIDQTRQQIRDMVDVAEKASNLNVSPQFYQGFVAEADKFKVSVGDLESALSHAFNATKEKPPIDLSAWETGKDRITEVERALRIYNETLAKAAGTRLEGLVLFRDANTQDDKIRAVLRAMTELNEIGQRTAALDLGEKMFGSSFVDRIRQGKTSAEEMLQTMKATAEASGRTFTDEQVRRAKDIDDQLKRVKLSLDQELKPSWDSLADKMLTIKSIWVDIIALITKAVAAANNVGILGSSSEFEKKATELANARKLAAQDTTLFGLPVPQFEREARQKRVDQLQAEVDKLMPGDIFSGAAPTQSKGTGEAPTLKKTDTGSDTNRFDSYSNSIEKRIAGLEAEARTMDLLTGAREKARIAAELETVARQANKEAGLGENVVTEEQRQKIDALAESYGRVKEAIEKAHSPLATFARESLNLNAQLNQFAASSLNTMTDELANVVTGTKSATDAFRSMANAIIADLARIAIRQTITGPIASALGGLFGLGGNGGELLNFGTSSFVGPLLPGKAEGGFTGYGGKYEPAGIVHKGEVVWSQRDVARAGGVGMVEALRLGHRGYADGGPVIGIQTPAHASRPGSAPQVEITSNTFIENHTDSQVTETKERNSSGGFDHRVIIKKTVNEGLANGDYGAALNSRYKSPQRIRRR